MIALVDLPGLLGKPASHASVVDFLAAHGVAPPPPECQPNMTHVVGGDALGLFVEFLGWARFAAMTAPPATPRKHPAEPPPDSGWMIFTIDLLSAGSNLPSTRAYAQPLPFGLAFGDRAEAIIAKLGGAPYAKSPGTNYAHAWWFLVGRQRALIALDQDERLIWMRLAAMDRGTALTLAKRKRLDAKSLTLRPTTGDASDAAPATRPTTAWTRRMHAGDTGFHADAVAQADQALDAFLAAIARATKRKSASAIYTAVKALVMAFNTLSEAHGSFVETTEREELCAYIAEVVTRAGLPLEPGEDLTAEWRAW